MGFFPRLYVGVKMTIRARPYSNDFLISLILSFICSWIFLSLKPNILAQAAATLLGSKTVRTGVSDGICMVEWILTSKSCLSLNGGQAMTGWMELAATTPERPLLRPA